CARVRYYDSGYHTVRRGWFDVW
nr:immunoglobulin heavy chain junction region [Macaca mulatta]MOW83864.1 immunoglobulin heavy chain junction region [Macaca mulatta]MOW86387.1 immunoglobulin heavy chain junction region [Macaca mulatta]